MFAHLKPIRKIEFTSPPAPSPNSERGSLAPRDGGEVRCSRKNYFSDKHLLSLKKYFLWVCIVSLLLVGCGSAGQNIPSSMPTQTSKPVIKFVINPWVGSAVNVEVARYLIEQKLGYPTDAVSMGSATQWDPLSKGTIDANMEVWAGAWPDQEKKYIQQDKTVEQGSNLGVIGQAGWYIPTYMVKAHPELASWQGFLKPENVALFATDKSDSKGQLFIGDRKWGGSFDQVISNLKLNLQIVYPDNVTDSEAATLAELDKAYQQQKPFLFYFWTPHWAYITYDLTEVELPPYTDECYAKRLTGGLACASPNTVLYKAYWSGLKNFAPDVYQLLQNFHYTNQDQIAMLAMVQLDKKTPREAAIAWVNQHQTVWQQWLPQ